MTHYARRISLIILTAMFACLATTAIHTGIAHAKSTSPIGEVVFLNGTVIAKQPDGESRTLDLNAPVMTGDVVATGAKSSVEIIFNDKSVFSQGPDSSTSLDDFVYSEDKSASKLLFTMGTGTFRYVTGHIVKQNPDAFALKTPTTTIGIRGTEIFALASSEEEEIGVLSMTPGHTVSVGPQTIRSAGRSVKANPKTGTVSPPAPTSPDIVKKVVKAAPQTSRGEIGSVGNTGKDRDNKVEAFRQHIERTKHELEGLGIDLDYEQLHLISVQTEARDTAENEQESGGSTTSDLSGGDDGDGGVGGPAQGQ